MVVTRIRRATANDIPRIVSFLKDNELPTEGFEKFVENFLVVLDPDASWIGVAGLEVYGKNGLLRSVAVDKKSRGMGHGRTLVNNIVANATERGIGTIYLLTDSAESYFKRIGFEVVSRDDIDEAVRASVEFTECCETAVAMRKFIR